MSFSGRQIGSPARWGSPSKTTVTLANGATVHAQLLGQIRPTSGAGALSACPPGRAEGRRSRQRPGSASTRRTRPHPR